MIRCSSPLLRWCMFAALCLLIAFFVPVSSARADVGIPPWSVPGSPPSPGDHATQVQMISENVMLIIEAHDNPDILSVNRGSLAANHMIGHVDATFQMRNQGAAPEAFDVWFPLWTPEYDYEIAPVQNFAVWVDGVPADLTTYYGPGDIQGPIEDLPPWATWFVTFPPGQDVEISVQYDIFPAGNEPYGSFHYILETGADWQGRIEQATITYRLPYPVNEVNTALDPHSRGMFGPTGPNPPDPAISGSDVVWQFTNLEPTTEDNIQLTVMDPEVWMEIEAAQQAVDANPDSFDAQLRLAYALDAGLEIYKTMVSQASSLDVANRALEAFQRALALSPDEASTEDIAAYFTLYSYRMWYANSMMNYPPEDTLWLLRQKMEDPAVDIGPVLDYLDLAYYMLTARHGVDLPGSPSPSDAFLAVVARASELDPNRATWYQYWQTLIAERGPFQVPPTATPPPTPEPTATAPPPVPTLVPSLAPASPTAPTRSLCPAALPLVLIVAAGGLIGSRRRKHERGIR